MPHFLYLLAASGRIPRLDPSKGAVAADKSFWELIARWYLELLVPVVRRDLIRDYRESTKRLTLIRGKTLPLPTARAFYSGRFQATCRFEDFDTDNPLNRVLRAAIVAIAGSTPLPLDLRRKARHLLAAFDAVGDLCPGDLSVTVERRTGWYADALALARSILGGQGRALDEGSQAVHTFLFRTPDLVEEGIRNLLTEGLPDWTIDNHGRQLKPSALTLNPDLVFNGGLAVGDIKYKIFGSDWHRPDLYQAVTFAAGFDTNSSLVVGFTTGEVPTVPPRVHVGAITVTPLLWRALEHLAPEDAVAQLASEVSEWLISATMTTGEQLELFSA
jgi:5-methylcytosine-specific restriction endonuclease McrBC regulatory subunit McrC